MIRHAADSAVLSANYNIKPDDWIKALVYCLGKNGVLLAHGARISSTRRVTRFLERLTGSLGLVSHLQQWQKNRCCGVPAASAIFTVKRNA